MNGAIGTEYEQLVVLAPDQRLRIVTMARPERLNALSYQLASELVDCLRRCVEESNVAAVILTGTGDRAFGAGIDVREAAESGAEERARHQERFLELHKLLSDYPVPTVAAINGIAAGASLQLALHCDIAVLGEAAKLGMPELSAGLPCIIGAWLLDRRVGPQLTADMVLSGRWLSATEAVGVGLAARVVATGEELKVATEIAREISSRESHAPDSVAATHHWLRQLRRGLAPESFGAALEVADEVLRRSNHSPLTNRLGRTEGSE